VPTLRVFQSAGPHGNCIIALQAACYSRLEIFVLIAIDRIKGAGAAPSIKLVDHDFVRIRMNV
jgi:hypothetical protein